MVYPDAPCYNCPDRHKLCWADCEKYKVWREKRDVELQARRDSHNENNLIMGMVLKRKKRRR